MEKDAFLAFHVLLRCSGFRIPKTRHPLYRTSSGKIKEKFYERFRISEEGLPGCIIRVSNPIPAVSWSFGVGRGGE
ncbi:MAG: hypothetical protein D6795_19010 [Deltaproteobacteria bacterium]|nr:MAG: hypothetical protein D6795_19010 [Deltaproteobacteria bacterium]